MLLETESLKTAGKNEDDLDTTPRNNKVKKQNKQDGALPGTVTKTKTQNCHTMVTTLKTCINVMAAKPEVTADTIVEAVSDLFEEDTGRNCNDHDEIFNLCR